MERQETGAPETGTFSAAVRGKGCLAVQSCVFTSSQTSDLNSLSKSRCGAVSIKLQL